MKKIFTLIAAAMMAVCANAQGTFKLAEGSPVPAANEVVSSVGNITMTWGNDTWKALATKTAVVNGENFDWYSSGTNNPKVDGANYTGSGVCNTGAYVTFTPKVTGDLYVGVVANMDKNLYVVEDGVSIAYKLNGSEVEAGYKPAEKVYGEVSFTATAGKSYQVLVGGSKISIYGFTFNVDPTGINNVTVASAAKVVKAIENGQLVIKSAKGTFNVAGAQMK